MRLALFFLLVVAVLGILLATQDANVDAWVPLELPFVDFSVSSPLIGWIGGSLGVGFVLGYLVALPGRIGASRRAKRIERELNQTSAERSKAVGHLNEAAPIRPATAPPTEADEMQRLADEVARRTETVQRGAPPPAV